MVDLQEARDLIASVRPRLDSLIALRADLAEIRADLAEQGSSPLGGLPEAKGFEARLHAELYGLADDGFEIKGYAPLLIDLPGERDGRAVLWCWLEGDDTIEWYHRADCGFAGRRPV
jgi:hypothetical protein